MKPRTIGWLGLLALLCMGAGWYWWQQQLPAPAAAPPVPVVEAPAPAVASAPAPAPAAPTIRHPMVGASATPASQAGAQPLPSPDKADSYFADALAELLGRKAVLSFLNTDGFAARFVTTVDNLDRAHAAARLWPVNPTAPRFLTVPSAEGMQISPQNAARYAPVVQFISAIPPAQAVALYRQAYPLFQQAYENLGYPGKYFNDRLVQVIDHLLETPDVAGPLKVKLTEVKGPIEPATPWVRYEYEDAALEARSAGQKLLLRMGPGHAREIKAKLTEVRGLIARQ